MLTRSHHVLPKPDAWGRGVTQGAGGRSRFATKGGRPRVSGLQRVAVLFPSLELRTKGSEVELRVPQKSSLFNVFDRKERNTSLSSKAFKSIDNLKIINATEL